MSFSPGLDSPAGHSVSDPQISGVQRTSFLDFSNVTNFGDSAAAIAAEERKWIAPDASVVIDRKGGKEAEDSDLDIAALDADLAALLSPNRLKKSSQRARGRIAARLTTRLPCAHMHLHGLCSC